MKKNLKLVAGIIAISAATLASCTKNKGASMNDDIKGSWQRTKLYEDANNNDIADSAEAVTSPAMQNLVYAINADGTFSISYSNQTHTSGTWTLQTSTRTLVLHEISSQGSNDHNLYLQTLNPTNMVIKDTSGGTTYWEYYTKQ